MTLFSSQSVNMFDNMKFIKFCVMLLIASTSASRRAIEPETSAETAKARFYDDFINKLYKAIGETQVSNMHSMLKIFTHSTVEQAQQVVQYIEEHSNITRAESKTLRMASNASVEITECVLKKEMDLLQAFRHTGYNLHNCIRSAQMSYEKAFIEMNSKLDTLKAKVVASYRNYSNMINNCLDAQCRMKTLLQSVVEYETLREELSLEVTETNNLSSRYIVTSIAMGCVSSSLQQIHHNYNLGKELMARCFHTTNNGNQQQQQQQQQQEQQQQYQQHQQRQQQQHQQQEQQQHQQQQYRRNY